MLSYSKLNLLLGCFNQFVFSDAKMNIDLIKLYYSQDAFSRDNTLINKFLRIINDYKFNDITESLFMSALKSDNKTDVEINELIGKIKEYKHYTKDQAQVFRNDLKEMCYTSFMVRAKNKFKDDPVGFTEELKKFTYKTNVSNNLSVKKFGELDITDLAHMYSGEGYKSSFKFINDSFTCGGYIPGQIVAVSAAPGCFHGDTEVMTLDGKTMKIKDIAESSNDDYLYVYSMNTDNGEFMPRISKASECRITKYVDHWTVLNIDGTSIKCTDDHPFMLIDGTYKKACELVPGDLLRSIERRSQSKYDNSKYDFNDYEYISTEGLANSYKPWTHQCVFDYYVKSGKFTPEKGVKYNTHHNLVIDNKFDRSNNLPFNLLILRESDHIAFHNEFRWKVDYDTQYQILINAGKETRMTSKRVSARNIEDWKRPEYRAAMREVTSKNGKKVTEVRNKPQSEYNGASLQRVMATKKYVKYLIDTELIKTAADLNEKVFNDNRYGPRTPSWESAMRYFYNDVDRLFNESKCYENHEVLSVSIEYCDTPEPAYDMVGVEFYSNYAIACGKVGSGVIVHNSGKSLFVQNEVVNFIKQGKRVHYLTLGDLNELDMATRLTCMMARKPKRVIESDILSYYSLYKDKFGDLLDLTVVPSGVVSAREYVDWVKEKADSYDILVIDYDSNFKKDGNLSMYDAYGDIYDMFTELSRLGKLVFVCTQPKIGCYKDEELTLESIGESSRKQHIIDMMIGIGKRSESKMRMGKMTICKSRRGDLGQATWIGTSEGLFYECSKVLYAKYRSLDTYQGLYTYDELSGQDILGDIFSDDGTELKL